MEAGNFWQYCILHNVAFRWTTVVTLAMKCELWDGIIHWIIFLLLLLFSLSSLSILSSLLFACFTYSVTFILLQFCMCESWFNLFDFIYLLTSTVAYMLSYWIHGSRKQTMCVFFCAVPFPTEVIQCWCHLSTRPPPCIEVHIQYSCAYRGMWVSASKCLFVYSWKSLCESEWPLWPWITTGASKHERDYDDQYSNTHEGPALKYIDWCSVLGFSVCIIFYFGFGEEAPE